MFYILWVIFTRQNKEWLFINLKFENNEFKIISKSYLIVAKLVQFIINLSFIDLSRRKRHQKDWRKSTSYFLTAATTFLNS